jgi:hypothetical protein
MPMYDSDWLYKLGSIEFVHNGTALFLEVGYISNGAGRYDERGTYLRLWERGRTDIIAGTWLERIINEPERSGFNSFAKVDNELVSKCIDIARRLERLKAFV